LGREKFGAFFYNFWKEFEVLDTVIYCSLEEFMLFLFVELIPGIVPGNIARFAHWIEAKPLPTLTEGPFLEAFINFLLILHQSLA
jgi:hypothetical protein